MTDRIERVFIVEYAVLWERVGIDDYGQPTVSATPVEIEVEWPRTSRESKSAQDSNQSKADEVVSDFPLTIGSILWYGRLSDLPSPAVDIPLYVITEATSHPDIKGQNYRYTAAVSRFSNTLPTTV